MGLPYDTHKRVPSDTHIALFGGFDILSTYASHILMLYVNSI